MTAVNLAFWDNGFGLSRDARILADALRCNGCDVALTALSMKHEHRRRRRRMRPYVYAQRCWHKLSYRGPPPRVFDLGIMFEHVWPDELARARCNVVLPNPEWFDHRDQHYLRAIDRVWAKTHNAALIFARLGCETDWVGFHSDDHYDPAIVRERKFLHLAGGSRIKGTDRLLAVWRRHPEWPLLTVLQHPREAHPGAVAPNIVHRLGYLNVSDPAEYAELKRLQNGCAFHLCTSETEGWGHYLVEALGVGAVALAVDAPPMNELVTPERGLLVPYAGTGSMALATTHYFDEGALEEAIGRVLGFGDVERRRLGERAREWFVQNRDDFVRRVGAALAATLR